VIEAKPQRPQLLSSTPPARPIVACLLIIVLASACSAASARPKKEEKKTAADPYAEFVWPPPPDEARIRLENVLTNRKDIEAESKFRRVLIGASPQSPFDQLRKPFAVEIDSRGRFVVSDSGSGALIRFDVAEKRYDILGTQGAVKVKLPLGLAIGANDSIYVADAAQAKVLAFTADGKLLGVWGRDGELKNPTDVAISPDGKKLYVADSKEHKIVVFDAMANKLLTSFGQRGEGDGEFSFPTSLAFAKDGNLLIVDQINARVQVFTPQGEFVEMIGGRGTTFGNFVRPKDVAVNEGGVIFVTDNAFNNVQLFDSEYTLLTFVGEGGSGPGRFQGASGVAARGDRFAVVDQLGARLQVFRLLKPSSAPR